MLTLNVTKFQLMELVFVKVIPASYQLQFQTALNDLFQAVFLLMDRYDFRN